MISLCRTHISCTMFIIRHYVYLVILHYMSGGNPPNILTQEFRWILCAVCYEPSHWTHLPACYTCIHQIYIIWNPRKKNYVRNIIKTVETVHNIDWINWATTRPAFCPKRIKTACRKSRLCTYHFNGWLVYEDPSTNSVQCPQSKSVPLPSLPNTPWAL